MSRCFYAFAAAAACLLLVSCSGGGGSGGGDAADGAPVGNQRYLGTFVDGSGAAIAGLTVTIPVNGKQGITNAAGVVEMITDRLLSGNVELQAQSPSGTVPLNLFGIRTDTTSVFYTVKLNGGRAAVTALTVDPFRADAVAFSPNCQNCHGVIGDANCASPEWQRIHTTVYRCNSGEGGVPGSMGDCTDCHGDRGAPLCDEPAWRAVHAYYPCGGAGGTQNAGSWKCTSCHEDKGHTRCGNPNFDGLHKFISCEGGTATNGLRCNSCHQLERRPLCNDGAWRATHNFWECGNSNRDCVSCHTYKGEARCNSNHWRTVHPDYSCSAGPSCSDCHSPKVDTVCDSARWKNIHNLVNGSAGGTSRLCSSCHDDDRGEAQCDDPTWKAFHCFCG